MIYITVAALAIAVLDIITTGQIVHWIVREQHRERAQLIDQICHLSGRTWSPPPSETWTPPDPAEDEQSRNWEQYPDGYFETDEVGVR